MDYYIVENSGAIVGKVSTNVSYIPGEGIAVEPETHYWDHGIMAFEPKASMPVVVEGLRISNIPSTGTIVVAGPLEYSGPVVGDEITLSFDLPGTYSVTITPDGVQWLPTTVTLEVT